MSLKLMLEAAVSQLLADKSGRTTVASQVPIQNTAHDIHPSYVDPSHQAETRAVPSEAQLAALSLEPSPSGKRISGKGWWFGALAAILALVVIGILIGFKIIPTTAPLLSENDQDMGTTCQSIENCLAEAERLISQEQHAEAIPYLDMALSFVPAEEQPFHAGIWCMRGEMHNNVGDIQVAIDDFLNCAAWAGLNDEMSALHEVALATAAELERQQQEENEPSKGLENGATQPDGECFDLDACRELAFTHAEQGHFDDAVHYVELALQFRPADEQVPFAYLWCHLGEFHLEMDRPEDAANDFRTCIEWAGDEPAEEGLRNYAQEQLNNLPNSP